MELEEGDVVLCTVERIAGTVVFVKIHYRNKELEGSIVLSEIAPGRIRNLRDYVVPKKKIVCKVLRIVGDRIDLSLRRTTPKETKEVLEKFKQEKSYENILKKILGDKAEEAINDISKKEGLYDFIEEAKENPKPLEEIIGKKNAEEFLGIVKSQKKKIAVVKKEIRLKTSKPNGIELIKEVLGKIKNAEVRYISAGRYSLRTESADVKKADTLLKSIISDVEKQAKKLGFEFNVVEKQK
jgi:translation initiation factor 2 alpha subunit (eIF-2alpha)